MENLLVKFKQFTDSSKYEFNTRLIMFLNYIKAKKNDNVSYVVTNSLLDMHLPSSSEILVFLNKSQIGSCFLDSPSEEKYSIIFDLEGFALTQNGRELNKERLLSNIHHLKNLGTLIILADYITISSFEIFINEQINKEPNVNYLVKSVIVHKSPFLSFISIQRFELKTPVQIDKIKIQLSETILRSELTIEKIHDLSLPEFSRANEYIYLYNEISHYLKQVSLL